MKFNIIILAAGLVLAACSKSEAPTAPKPALEASQSKSGNKGPKDYKALFGPNYKRGDIGHSTGVLIGQETAANLAVIEHGVIHGIDRSADTTKFEILDKTDISDISSGAKVEFLVKKGPDTIYRLFAICEILEDDESCL